MPVLLIQTFFRISDMILHFACKQTAICIFERIKSSTRIFRLYHNSVLFLVHYLLKMLLRSDCEQTLPKIIVRAFLMHLSLIWICEIRVSYPRLVFNFQHLQLGLKFCMNSSHPPEKPLMYLAKFGNC